MAQGTVGISISASDAQSGVDQIVRAEELGVAAAWMTSGGGGGDSLTVLAATKAGGGVPGRPPGTLRLASRRAGR